MSSYKAYKTVYSILNFLYRLFYRPRIEGRENIPDGAVIICANHSGMTDILLASIAFTKNNHLHFMAKIELISLPVIGNIIKKIGSFGVDRGGADIKAVRTAMKYLKSGEKVVIFPEGTRLSSADISNAKRGAVVMANRCAVPIIPVYIPRKKRLFSKINVIIGNPYTIPLDRRTATNEDYKRESEGLLERIEDLGRHVSNA